MSANLDCLNLSTSAYLADTQHLSLPQHGAYLLIMMTMRRAKGWLPDDDRVLATICKLSTAKWKKIAPEIRSLLIEQDGRLTQKRLLSEVEKDLKVVSKNRENGSAGGRAKALKNKEPSVATATISPATRQRSSSGDSTPLLTPTEVEVRVSRKSSCGTRLPSDWQPAARDRDYGRALGLIDSDIDAMAEDMRLWADSNANRPVGRKSDWPKAFKLWMRREAPKLIRERLRGNHNGAYRQRGTAGFARNLADYVSGETDHGQEETAGYIQEVH